MHGRSAYVEKMKLQIAVWNKKVEKIHQSCRTTDSERREMLERAARELAGIRDRATAKLKEAEDVADCAWDELEDGFETAWHRLSSTARSIRDRIGR